MSTDTKTEVKADDNAKPDRQQMSWPDRIAIVDYLRSLRAPLTFEQKAAAAAHVSTEAKVEVSWSQLRYLIDQFPLLKLDEKFIFGDEATIANLSLLGTRIIALESFVGVQGQTINDLKSRLVALEGGVL